jgi:hypothetical protein
MAVNVPPMSTSNGDPTRKENPDWKEPEHGSMTAAGHIAGVRFIDVWDEREKRSRRFFNLDTPEQFEALRGAMVSAMVGEAADASAPVEESPERSTSA